eukprot:2454060-Amphidinium_carterae.4
MEWTKMIKPYTANYISTANQMAIRYSLRDTREPRGISKASGFNTKEELLTTSRTDADPTEEESPRT